MVIDHMNKPGQNEISEQQLEQASHWLTLTASASATEQDWLDFTSWLEENELNRMAYNQVEDINAFIDLEASALAKGIQGGVNNSNNVVELFGWRRVVKTNWQTLAGVATGIAAMLFVAVSISNFGVVPDQTSYYSAASERRLVQLADGSSLHLNVNTNIEMTMSENGRQAHLLKGEVLFDIAPNKKRPFYVAVEDRQIRVVGTIFNVLSHQGKLVVTVAEGVVEVAPAPEHTIEPAENPSPDSEKMDGNYVASQPERLMAGDQLIQIAGKPTFRRNNVNVNRVTAWQDGFMDYENALLSVVVADLNRYFERQIILQGKAASMRFSGVLDLRDQEAILALLLDVLPIELSRAGETIIINDKK